MTIESIQQTVQTMGQVYNRAQAKGYYSSTHSLASAVAWALAQCSALRPAAILQWWMAGYAMA